MALRILVVDDQEAARRAISSILAKRLDWHVCGEAADGVEAVARAKTLRPDAILMDVSMPNMDGLQATREVRRHLPTAKIVIVSQNDASVVRQQAVQVHADAYVRKDKLAQHLISSLAALFPEAPEPLDPSAEDSGDDVSAWLQAGGEMAERMRSFDWSRTPLGPTKRWPQSLKTSLSICLASRFPIVMYWGAEYVVLYNDAYSAILGSKHPGALGQPCRHCWDEIWDTIGPMLDSVVNSGRATWSDDLLLPLQRRGYAEECYFSFSFSPVRVETGHVGGIFTAVIETTEKVIGARRLRTLRDLASRAVEAKTEADVWRIAARTLGEDLHDLPFTILCEVSGPEPAIRLLSSAGIEKDHPWCGSLCTAGPTIWQDVLNVAESRQARQANIVCDSPEALPCGAWHIPPKSVMILPIGESGPEKPASVLVAAVSPHKHLDESYRTFFQLVANQVASAAADARAYEQERKRAEVLAEIDRAKTLFFSNVSHEFRTPLTLMLGPLEDTLASDIGLPEEHRNNLQVAHRNSLRLLKLVNTLLDFSRIEAGRIQACYEPTDLAGFTVELASLFRSAVERAGLRLLVNCDLSPDLVYVDREMWEKIVFNLLSNAFKFTFKGEIEVSLKKAGNTVELSVRDTGTGIPAKDLPHLFERFYRVQGARGRTWEGSGIGLALVQELVKLHSGRVRVESQLDQGSTFIVAVPLGKDHLLAQRIGAARVLDSSGINAEAYVQEALHWSASTQDISEDLEIASFTSARAALSPERKPNQVSRVLFADDNADMRQYLSTLLNPRYEVIPCEDGQVAMEQARQKRPDLVLADVMMPGMDGFGLLRALREDSELCDVPVILLSARAGEESRIEGLDAGADDYLVKPFSARELMARVGSHLAMAKVRREAAELKGRNTEMLRQSERVRELSWRLLRAQDEERRHIARELHDSAGQTLTVLGMSLARLVQKTGRTAPELATDAETIQEMVQQLHRDIRTTSYLLHPPLLDESGLCSALSWYTQGLVERSSLEINLDISQEFGRLPRDMELVVFRVVQECLTNIHRHSGSKTANIRIAREPDQITVEIQDHGQGISTQRLAEVQSAGSGVGIRGMRERLSQFHGEMKIESDNIGTRILVSIPVSESATAENKPMAASLRTAV